MEKKVRNFKKEKKTKLTKKTKLAKKTISKQTLIQSDDETKNMKDCPLDTTQVPSEENDSLDEDMRTPQAEINWIIAAYKEKLNKSLLYLGEEKSQMIDKIADKKAQALAAPNRYAFDCINADLEEVKYNAFSQDTENMIKNIGVDSFVKWLRNSMVNLVEKLEALG